MLGGKNVVVDFIGEQSIHRPGGTEMFRKQQAGQSRYNDTNIYFYIGLNQLRLKVLYNKNIQFKCKNSNDAALDKQ